MTVKFTRRTGSGVNAKRPLHLYLHNYSSAPSGQLNLGDGPEELLSLSVGATGRRRCRRRGVRRSRPARRRGSRSTRAAAVTTSLFQGGSITITFT
jgi:hypothetical protein